MGLKLLLDTHAFFWAAGSSRRLSRKALRAINETRNEIWLSPASVVEIAALIHKQKVSVVGGFDDWLDEALDRLNCREAPLTLEVARETRALFHPGLDPADRIIAATARVYDLTLVTADEALIAAKNVPTMVAG